MSSEILTAALEYKKRGFIVHPLSSPKTADKKTKELLKNAGKAVLIKEWEKRESITDENLMLWFSNNDSYFKDCNIGIQCGYRSGIMVLDFDHELFKDDIFHGIELNTLISGRTNGRGHIYFKFHPILISQKHHELGIEVLSNGSNAVLPPSVHKSGDVYKWKNPDAPIMEMPEEVIKRLNILFRTETELKQIISKCRHCFRDIIKRKPDMHGAEGREYMIAVCTDMKAKDATEDHIKIFAKLMYGKDYKETETLKEWKNIDSSKTWTCDKLREKLPAYVDLTQCDKCKDRRDKYNEFKDKKIVVKAPLELPPIPHEAIDKTCNKDELLIVYKKWLAIREDYNIIAPVCAFLGNFVPGEPDIIGIIAPSGSTKTEIIRAFGQHENQFAYPISSITEHTFVSGLKENIDTIPLLRGRVLLIKDLTTLLSKKEDIRASVFADFRDITDGYIHKEFGNGIKKEYSGIHSSILFASTNAIERYYSMYSNLGQRMIFIRPDNDPRDARKQSEVNRNKLDIMRVELHEVTMRFINTTIQDVKKKGCPTIPDEIKEEIGNMSDFLAIVRTSIHHDFKGEIDEIPEPEFPTRIFNTICKLTEIHAFINNRTEVNNEDQDFAYRVIRDNIPVIRLRILTLLTTGWQTTPEICKQAELPTRTGRRVLDELVALHIVQKLPRDMKDGTQEDGRSDSFCISEDMDLLSSQLNSVIRIDPNITDNRVYVANLKINNNSSKLNQKSITEEGNIYYPPESHPSIFCDICKQPLNGSQDLTQGLPGQGMIHKACKYLPIQIRFIVDVQNFMAIDNRLYPADRSGYKAGDIAHIPAINAGALIMRRAAEKVEGA